MSTNPKSLVLIHANQEATISISLIFMAIFWLQSFLLSHRNFFIGSLDSRACGILSYLWEKRCDKFANERLNLLFSVQNLNIIQFILSTYISTIHGLEYLHIKCSRILNIKTPSTYSTSKHNAISRLRIYEFSKDCSLSLELTVKSIYF